MGIQAVEALLGDRIGLDPASIGHDEVVRVVEHRMRETGDARMADYVSRLGRDADEWGELVELLLVKVTWFFREPSGFDVLAARAIAHRDSGARRRFRALSLPCASGEEAYSMAITLLDAGLDAGRFHVEGLDLSGRAISAARRGTYADAAVRMVPAPVRHRHFEHGPAGHRVKDHARRAVSFRVANLLDGSPLAAIGPFDVVFCRNVMIYFTSDARQRVLATLGSLLRDDGVLVTGHAEPAAVVAPRFVPAGIPRAFAYRKAAARGDADVAGPRVTPGRVPAPSAGPAAAPRPAPRAAGALTHDARGGASSIAASDRKAPATLAEARRLADAGRFDDARVRCETYLASRPASADGYFLLGLVESGAGRPAEAERALRRSLYLEPRHDQALQLLALERERLGDAREAALLRRRARLATERVN